MKITTRKKMLYKTKVDYQVDDNGKPPINDYAMNHVLGCSHGCKYPCYAMLTALRYGYVKSYEDWCEPSLVSNTLELLSKELRQHVYYDTDSGKASFFITVNPKFSDPFDDGSYLPSAITDLICNHGYNVDRFDDDCLRITVPACAVGKPLFDKIRSVLRKWDLSYRFPSEKPAPKRVHLCFTTDPLPYLSWDELLGKYRFKVGGHAVPPHWEIQDMTMSACELINSYGVPVTVLTKGLLPHFKSGDDGTLCLPVREGYSKLWKNPHPDNYYGISLVSLNEGFRKEWEPNTAPYVARIESLYRLHQAGCKTWVSMEPFPALASWDYNELYGEKTTYDILPGLGRDNLTSLMATFGIDLDDVMPVERAKFLCEGCYAQFSVLLATLCSVSFVDRIVFGRWNYNKAMPHGNADDSFDSLMWYTLAAGKVRNFCAEQNIECIIKSGTE